MGCKPMGCLDPKPWRQLRAMASLKMIEVCYNTLEPPPAYWRSTMKVLFIGGTGIISSACTRLAVEQGIELFLLNRGNHPDIPAGATNLTADIRDQSATARALAGQRFDAVVDWIAFTPDEIERDLALFRDTTRQYIFISSASAY